MVIGILWMELSCLLCKLVFVYYHFFLIGIRDWMAPRQIGQVYLASVKALPQGPQTHMCPQGIMRVSFSSSRQMRHSFSASSISIASLPSATPSPSFYSP